MIEVVQQFSFGLQGLVYCLLLVLLVALSVIDIKTYSIPNKYIVIGVVLWATTIWFIPADQLVYGNFLGLFGHNSLSLFTEGLVAAFLTAGGVLLFSQLFEKVTNRYSLGGGDIKLYFMISLYLGIAGSLLALFLSCVIGLVFSLLWTKIKPSFHGEPKKEKAPSKPFPFGPSIALAGALTLLVGPFVIPWYFGL